MSIDQTRHHELSQKVMDLCNGDDSTIVIAALGHVMSIALSSIPQEIGIPAMLDMTSIIISAAYPDAEMEISRVQ